MSNFLLYIVLCSLSFVKTFMQICLMNFELFFIFCLKKQKRRQNSGEYASPAGLIGARGTRKVQSAECRVRGAKSDLNKLFWRKPKYTYCAAERSGDGSSQNDVCTNFAALSRTVPGALPEHIFAQCGRKCDSALRRCPPMTSDGVGRDNLKRGQCALLNYYCRGVHRAPAGKRNRASAVKEIFRSRKVI